MGGGDTGAVGRRRQLDSVLAAPERSDSARVKESDGGGEGGVMARGGDVGRRVLRAGTG